MIILGIETSGPVCSVAVAANGVLLSERSHDVVGQAAESLLGLLEGALADAQLVKSALTRVAVGVGPGSFVGLRVGLAFANGIALGLGLEAVGVGSLASMARGLGVGFQEPMGGQLPTEEASECAGRTRVCVVDARRGEYFVAAYGEEETTLLAPSAVPIAALEEFVRARFSPDSTVVLGVKVDGYREAVGRFCRVPHACGVALLGQTASPERNPPIPDYLREADAIRPNLPDSPLHLPRI